MYEEDGWYWFVLDVNPEPWAVGPVGTGRRNGKVYAYVGQNAQLKAYQEAVQEALGDPGIFFDGEPVQLQFYFWRNRADYQTHQAKTHRKHEADGTNLSKATEDALQGVLIKNDKDVKRTTWEIVDQGPDVIGKVALAIRKYDSAEPYFPRQVTMLLDEIDNPPDTNRW